MKLPKMRAEKVDLSSLLSKEALPIYKNHILEMLYQYNEEVPNTNPKQYNRQICPSVYLGIKIPKEEIINDQPADKYKKELADMFNLLVEDGIVIGGVIADACLIFCKDSHIPHGEGENYTPDFGALVLYTFSHKTMREINEHLFQKGLIGEDKRIAFNEGGLPE